MSAAPVMRRRVSLRALAWRASYNRHLATAAVVVLAGLVGWRTLDPPAKVVERLQSGTARDRPAEVLVEQFAAAYLSFDAEEPEARSRALARFGSAGVIEAGYEAPRRGRRTVGWAQVVQSFAVPQGTRYVVAAGSLAGATSYLSATVRRDGQGALQLVGAPAIVGAPVSAAALTEPTGVPVRDDGLRAVVERAMRNYLSAAGDDLAADLASTATVSLPAQPMALEAVEQLRWESGAPGAVLVTAAVRDQAGQRLQLTYELSLQQQQDRWLVAGIQNNPTGQ